MSPFLFRFLQSDFVCLCALRTPSFYQISGILAVVAALRSRHAKTSEKVVVNSLFAISMLTVYSEFYRMHLGELGACEGDGLHILFNCSNLFS